ncbi:cupin domain-containing protein [Actinopolymorpha alba]|uniref:cupin domain-containing protein n=1 Tax=Actinopolymorpha alba TaxID=533267 RepID=UPI000368D4BC|nr:cupin domain-containing protein [Actinopolymorpha alba]
MSVFVTRIEEVAADENDRRTIWRLLNSSTVPDLTTANAGIVSYRPRPEGAPPAELGGAHDFPEFYYVVSGKGVVAGPDGEATISEGDSFLIQAGTPHSIWSTADEPVTTFYVALRGR